MKFVKSRIYIICIHYYSTNWALEKLNNYNSRRILKAKNGLKKYNDVACGVFPNLGLKLVSDTESQTSIWDFIHIGMLKL